jgi:dihydroorotate dehydrogenase (NAD+) catalytic subunit
MTPAFYDPTISYEENYKNGPPIAQSGIKPRNFTATKRHKFLGFDVNIPFGIPPGPLLNSEFMKAAFAWGFDVSTYKTVRASEFPCHPFPNVLYVDAKGELHPAKTPRLSTLSSPPSALRDVSITNSFGVPSRVPHVWQEDVKKALTYVGDGQLMILSFMGTVREHQSQEEFIQDFVQAAKLSVETGVKAVEANLSCPNIGNEGLVCYNLDVTEAICQAIRQTIGNTPFIIKVGYYKDQEQLEKLTRIAHEYADAVAAINTLQIEVVDENGEQALPGKNRLRSGVCGASIKWAGLEMTQRLSEIRKRNNYRYEILGIGGVMTHEDYSEYRIAGADAVQSATGAMWNPDLAYEIGKMENE